MARKFAEWLVRTKTSDQISTLENRAMEETLVATFVNLAEFSRLEVEPFLNSFVFNCALLDHKFKSSQYTYFEDILVGKSKKTIFDVMIDCFVKCGLLPGLIRKLPGSSLVNVSQEQLRITLYTILNQLTDKFALFIDEYNNVLLEDSSQMIVDYVISLITVSNCVFT